jgi:simple sugar transport system ATP-binding protein
MIESDQIAVQMQNITKAFPGVQANNGVNFELRKGEIHALLGENGAGKSTLMNILIGLYRPEKGRILLNGVNVEFRSPRDAINLGIGMVHQHFMLVPTLTVTENILLSLETPKFFLNLAHCRQLIQSLGNQYSLQVDPNARIWQLSVGEQQRVEILKVLARGANTLILDEPTAVLSPNEINVLFETLRRMTSQGKSVVFISHKLYEVMQISDRITVMRRGVVTSGGVKVTETSIDELAYRMVGRKVLFHIDKKEQTPGNEILSIEGLYADNDKGLPALRGASLTVREGEIVGLAGVTGNGQSELAETILGLRLINRGFVQVYGQIKVNSLGKNGNRSKMIRNLINASIAYIPEDRLRDGVAPNLDVTDNAILKDYWKPPFSRGHSIDYEKARDRAKSLRERFEISFPNVKTRVRSLSGGNLQRLILGREIFVRPRLIVAVQPTRGLDVGAIEVVRHTLIDQREAGTGILLISEELDELISLCDRIYVIYRGEIMGVIKGEISDPEVQLIGLMMAGTRLASVQSQTR